MLGDYGIEQAGEGGIKYMLLHGGDTMDPDDVKVPKSQDEWIELPTNTAKGYPTFEKLDNPDGCSSFSFHPVFASGAQGGQ